MKLQTLFRPVGLKEMELIAQSQFKAFPPRLEWQPIFYPVMNQAYAEQIALEWNTKDEFSGYCGIVTSFNLNADDLKKFEVQNVGAEQHNELWVPAQELEEFNTKIVNGIKIVNVFFGEAFKESTNRELNLIIKKFR